MLRLAIHYENEVRHFPLPLDTARLGAAPENDLVAPFPGVSRQHALVQRRAGGLLVTDLGSTNGLVREGRRCDRVLLTPGASLRIGGALLVLEELASSDAETALRLSGSGDPGPKVTAPHETEALRSPAEPSPAAALRWVREVEAIGEEPLDERRPELLRGARALLAAESLLLLDLASAELSVVDGDGPFPADEILEALGRAAEGAGPRLLQEPQPILLAGRGPLRLAGLFSWTPEAWQQDFFAYVAEKLAPGEARMASRPPLAPPEGKLHLPPGMVVGTSPAFQALLPQIEAIARSDFNVLLTGETGTGKEVFARLIHGSGRQARGQFVAINCAAIPAELLEAELFGVAARVATGVDPRQGLFVQAHSGTLLLDEVGELPERLQAKLLRVLQEREVMPLGASAPRKVDVRVIAASNRDLAQRVREGSFRSDLYYRLRGLELHLPPLRERREDLPHLVLAFAGRAASKHRKRLRGVSRGALRLLLEHDWPGNVREMESEVERAVLLCPDGGLLQREHFLIAGPPPPRDQEPRPPALSAPEDGPASNSLQAQVDALERQAILAALVDTQGNKTAAARALGITRNGLALKMKRLGIG